MKTADKIEHWQNLKFGMFIHFGLYSLAGGVWKGSPVTNGYSEQILSHGEVDPIEYQHLMDEFSVEKFDATAIAALAKDAGMTYIVITSKHHDGFCLFDTATTEYNSSKSKGKRDLVKELASACRDIGLEFGLYYSWIDWNHPSALPFSDHNSDLIPKDHMQLNLDQLTELLSNYGSICELWMDMGAPTKDQSCQIAELARSLQPNIMINGRIWNGVEDFYVLSDNQIPDFSMTLPWQTPASIYHETWGYRSWQKRDDLQGKIVEQIRNIACISARGGNLLLNIGPKGDGSVVPFEQEVLRGIGKWLKTHRKAVFGTVPGPWNSFSWGECAAKAKTLYLFQINCPESGKIFLPGLRSKPICAEYLDPNQKLSISMDTQGVVVSGLEHISGNPLPVIALIFDEEPLISEPGFILSGDDLQKLPEGKRKWGFKGKEYHSYKPFIEAAKWVLQISGSGLIEFSWKTDKQIENKVTLICRIHNKVIPLTLLPGTNSGMISIIDPAAQNSITAKLELKEGLTIPETLSLFVLQCS